MMYKKQHDLHQREGDMYPGPDHPLESILRHLEQVLSRVTGQRSSLTASGVYKEELEELTFSLASLLMHASHCLSA